METYFKLMKCSVGSMLVFDYELSTDYDSDKNTIIQIYPGVLRVNFH